MRCPEARLSICAACCCLYVLIALSHLSKVPRMVLVHVNSVVMLTSSITATSRMFPVLSNTSMSSTDVTPLFPVLVQVCNANTGATVNIFFLVKLGATASIAMLSLQTPSHDQNA